MRIERIPLTQRSNRFAHGSEAGYRYHWPNLLVTFLLLGLAPGVIAAQGVNSATIGLFKTPAEMWPTYNGDYSGRRFSEIDQINQSNIDIESRPQDRKS